MSEGGRDIDAIFLDALDQPASRRSDWLRRACGGDEAIEQAVRRLLSSHERAEGILDRAPASDVAKLLNEAVSEPIPERIGRYRPVEKLGRGGMGTVFLADRDDDQFHQQVAIKILRPDPDAADVLERFFAERQILASLHHPNIARLLDGGVTQDGRPYLVMEYVAGRPLDAFCDDNRLTIAERVRLFCAVARAVHHAHRNLVVHRDLKPSNILVTGEGEVKLLDFGIAKILDSAADHAAPETRTGLRLMTPEYASPEQIGARPITTATDVYGLGVVLYELLSGRRPFDLRGRSLGEVERLVVTEEPPRPSAAASRGISSVTGDGGTDADTADIARARRTTPDRLRRVLEGDLDRIVSMAIRKEPERRYRSADQLAEDLERYLEGRPVMARGESRTYRMRKFTGRHRWKVVGTTAFAVLLAGYAVTASRQSRQVRNALERARIEAEKSEQLTTFLMRLFERDDAGGSADQQVASELLSRGLARAELLREQPATQAQMLDVVARVYQYLGRYEEAYPPMVRALELRRGVYGPNHLILAESLYNLAELESDRGNYEEADRLFRQALAIQRAALGEQHTTIARTLNGLSVSLRDRGDYDAAEPLAREALAMRRRLLGNEHPDVAESINYLGALLRRKGNYAASEPLYREALAMRRRLLGNEHPDVAESINNLALQLSQMGNLDAAEPLYREAADMYRRLLGARHPFVATTIGNLGSLLVDRGDYAGAEPLLRESLAIRREALGDDHPDVALALGGLAELLQAKGDVTGAEKLALEALDIRRRVLGSEHPAVASSLSQLGGILTARRAYAEAEPLLTDALALRRQTLGAAHPQTRTAIERLVTLYDAWKRPEDAARYRAMLSDGNAVR